MKSPRGTVRSDGKRLERRFLEKMLGDLSWQDRRIVDGSEPPDFILDSDTDRRAVEITRIYQREHAKGSPEAAQERGFERFVSNLRDAYFGGAAPQSIQVSVILPPIIRSPAVRQWTRQERRADLNDVMQRALA